jgi:hypothetical protein
VRWTDFGAPGRFTAQKTVAIQRLRIVAILSFLVATAAVLAAFLAWS